MPSTENVWDTWYGTVTFRPGRGGFNEMLIMEAERDNLRVYFWGQPGDFYFWRHLTERQELAKVGGWIFV